MVDLQSMMDDVLFGGVLVILGGDFAQILLVVYIARELISYKYACNGHGFGHGSVNCPYRSIYKSITTCQSKTL
jgi:hypothetical protein